MLRREIDRIKRECQPLESTACDAGANHSHLPLMAEEADVVVVGREPVDHRVERRKLVPGARLLRNWNGATHAVDVTGDGYLYNEVTYRSLSAIARRITGAHWSGPRFFGL